MKTSHPLDGDGLNTEIFKHLARASRSSESERLSFRVPDTVLYYSCASFWFHYDEASQTVRKRPPKWLEKQTIFNFFSRRPPQSKTPNVAATTRSNIVAQFCTTDEDGALKIEYFCADALHDFLFGGVSEAPASVRSRTATATAAAAAAAADAATDPASGRPLSPPGGAVAVPAVGRTNNNDAAVVSADAMLAALARNDRGQRRRPLAAAPSGNAGGGWAARDRSRRVGILQKFVEPRTDMLDCVQVAYSPALTAAVRRVNRCKLYDRARPPVERCATFDGPSHRCDEYFCNPHTTGLLASHCASLARHVSKVEPGCDVGRCVAYFRQDAEDHFWLLFVTSVRVVERRGAIGGVVAASGGGVATGVGAMGPGMVAAAGASFIAVNPAPAVTPGASVAAASGIGASMLGAAASVGPTLTPGVSNLFARSASALHPSMNNAGAGPPVPSGASPSRDALAAAAIAAMSPEAIAAASHPRPAIRLVPMSLLTHGGPGGLGGAGGSDPKHQHSRGPRAATAAGGAAALRRRSRSSSALGFIGAGSVSGASTAPALRSSRTTPRKSISGTPETASPSPDELQASLRSRRYEQRRSTDDRAAVFVGGSGGDRAGVVSPVRVCADAHRPYVPPPPQRLLSPLRTVSADGAGAADVPATETARHAAAVARRIRRIAERRVALEAENELLSRNLKRVQRAAAAMLAVPPGLLRAPLLSARASPRQQDTEAASVAVSLSPRTASPALSVSPPVSPVAAQDPARQPKPTAAPAASADGPSPKLSKAEAEAAAVASALRGSSWRDLVGVASFVAPSLSTRASTASPTPAAGASLEASPRAAGPLRVRTSARLRRGVSSARAASPPCGAGGSGGDGSGGAACSGAAAIDVVALRRPLPTAATTADAILRSVAAVADAHRKAAMDTAARLSDALYPFLDLFRNASRGAPAAVRAATKAAKTVRIPLGCARHCRRFARDAWDACGLRPGGVATGAGSSSSESESDVGGGGGGNSGPPSPGVPAASRSASPCVSPRLPVQTFSLTASLTGTTTLPAALASASRVRPGSASNSRIGPPPSVPPFIPVTKTAAAVFADAVAVADAGDTAVTAAWDALAVFPDDVDARFRVVWGVGRGGGGDRQRGSAAAATRAGVAEPPRGPPPGSFVALSGRVQEEGWRAHAAWTAAAAAAAARLRAPGPWHAVLAVIRSRRREYDDPPSPATGANSSRGATGTSSDAASAKGAARPISSHAQLLAELRRGSFRLRRVASTATAMQRLSQSVLSNSSFGSVNSNNNNNHNHINGLCSPNESADPLASSISGGTGSPASRAALLAQIRNAGRQREAAAAAVNTPWRASVAPGSSSSGETASSGGGATPPQQSPPAGSARSVTAATLSAAGVASPRHGKPPRQQSSETVSSESASTTVTPGGSVRASSPTSPSMALPLQMPPGLSASPPPAVVPLAATKPITGSLRAEASETATLEGPNASTATAVAVPAASFAPLPTSPPTPTAANEAFSLDATFGATVISDDAPGASRSDPIWL